MAALKPLWLRAGLSLKLFVTATAVEIQFQPLAAVDQEPLATLRFERDQAFVVG
jgi:hypothetical protein